MSMSAISEHWDDSKCCCHAPDAVECFRSRHRVHSDQHHDAEYDGDCECTCHAEYERNLDDAGIYENEY